MSVRRRQIITASGTWTTPTGVSVVDLIVVGGGGGGGATSGGSTGLAGGGGGGGQVIDRRGVRVSGSITVAIGAGGAGGSGSGSATIGGRGGQTTFGDLIAWGGQGGQGNSGASTGTPQGPNTPGGYFGGMCGLVSGSTSRMGGSGGSGHPQGSAAGGTSWNPNTGTVDMFEWVLGREGGPAANTSQISMPGSHWMGYGNGGAGGYPNAATWGSPIFAAPNAGGGGAGLNVAGQNAPNNFGGGGGGAGTGAALGGNGGSGVIIVYWWE